MKKLLLGLVGGTCLVGACSTEVTIEEQSSSGNSSSSSSSTGSSSTGSSSTGSSSSSSSSTSSGTTMCVPMEEPPMPEPATCKELERLILVDPVITGDSDGDGLVEPGEAAVAKVIIRDVSGLGFNYYPGVEFSTSEPLASIESNAWFFAVLPCTDQEAMAQFKIAPSITPGTVITIRAKLAMLNNQCPDSFALDIPVKVQ